MTSHVLSVAVIGAGIAGLAAARALHRVGHRVTVWEKGSRVGGRIGTRRHGEVFFDHGAQNVKAEGTALESEVRRMQEECELTTIAEPVCQHNDGKILHGDADANSEQKWSCRNGLAALPNGLANGLDVRLNSPIHTLEETGDSYLLHDSAGKVLDTVHFVIVTAPAPQTAELLENGIWREDQGERIALLRSVEYSRCLSVLLHIDAPDDDLPWYALLAADRQHPLLWLARENAKGFVPFAGQTALVAQLGHEASIRLWEENDSRVVHETVNWISGICGDRLHSVLWSNVKRWRYSLPLNTISFEAANPSETRVLICGDATARGRVPDAYESGLKAAQRITDRKDSNF